MQGSEPWVQKLSRQLGVQWCEDLSSSLGWVYTSGSVLQQPWLGHLVAAQQCVQVGAVPGPGQKPEGTPVLAAGLHAVCRLCLWCHLVAMSGLELQAAGSSGPTNTQARADGQPAACIGVKTGRTGSRTFLAGCMYNSSTQLPASCPLSRLHVSGPALHRIPFA